MAKKSRSMIASLIILIIFSLVVFYFGWAQLRVKTNTIGIVISKTGGINEKIAESGKFSWYWQFLIPRNAELQLYSVLPYNFEKTVKGVLPSASDFNQVNTFKPDFSYNADFSISLSISKEGIIDLVKQKKIASQNDLNQYMERKADSLCQAAEYLFIQKFTESTPKNGYLLEPKDILSNTDFYQNNPDIEILDFTITNQKIPDYDFYQKSKNGMLNLFKNESSFESSNSNDTDKAVKLLLQLLKSNSESDISDNAPKSETETNENLDS